MHQRSALAAGIGNFSPVACAEAAAVASAVCRKAGFIASIILGLALRVGRLFEHPFIHADGPGYIALARRIGAAPWQRIFTDYYPPGFAFALRAVHDTTGLDWEASGRVISLAAGVALIPLTARLGRTLHGPAVGGIAALLAADTTSFAWMELV